MRLLVVEYGANTSPYPLPLLAVVPERLEVVLGTLAYDTLASYPRGA